MPTYLHINYTCLGGGRLQLVASCTRTEEMMSTVDIVIEISQKMVLLLGFELLFDAGNDT